MFDLMNEIYFAVAAISFKNSFTEIDNASRVHLNHFNGNFCLVLHIYFNGFL